MARKRCLAVRGTVQFPLSFACVYRTLFFKISFNICTLSRWWGDMSKQICGVYTHVHEHTLSWAFLKPLPFKCPQLLFLWHKAQTLALSVSNSLLEAFTGSGLSSTDLSRCWNWRKFAEKVDKSRNHSDEYSPGSVLMSGRVWFCFGRSGINDVFQPARFLCWPLPATKS